MLGYYSACRSVYEDRLLVFAVDQYFADHSWLHSRPDSRNLHRNAALMTMRKCPTAPHATMTAIMTMNKFLQCFLIWYFHIRTVVNLKLFWVFRGFLVSNEILFFCYNLKSLSQSKIFLRFCNIWLLFFVIWLTAAIRVFLCLIIKNMRRWRNVFKGQIGYTAARKIFWPFVSAKCLWQLYLKLEDMWQICLISLSV